MTFQWLNSREVGDLMDEVNAHRLRVNCRPHPVRVMRQDTGGSARPGFGAPGRERYKTAIASTSIIILGSASDATPIAVEAGCLRVMNSALTRA